jgi:alpha-N-arabinofuranosidase
MTQNLIAVESHRPARRYDRMIFGQFLEHFHRQVYGGVFEPGSPLSDQNGFRTDVVEAMRELEVPIVRWPGGCFVSAYHWTDGVGPSRQPAFDKAWQVEDPNTFGTDEFVAWCRLIGAEPYICTNAGSGTPEEMSDWVEYCNLESAGKWARSRVANGHTVPHGVKYWSIGNENYGAWEMGAKTRDEWGRFVAESAKMMLKVDPDIKLLAAASHDPEWNLNLLREAGEYLDYISVHLYADILHQDDTPSGYAACMSRTLLADDVISAAEAEIQVSGLQGKVKIAFDEWNLRGWHHPSISPSRLDVGARDRNDINATYTMADAVFTSCFLNTCLRHSDSVRMANMAPVINTRGPLYVHPKGIVKRTTFHVMQMYAAHLRPNVTDCWVRSENLDAPAMSMRDAAIATGAQRKPHWYEPGQTPMPALDVVATCDDTGREWSVAVANRHRSKPISSSLRVGSGRLPSRVERIVLAGPDADAYNDVDAPDRVVPEVFSDSCPDGVLEFPPHSVSIVKFSL